MSDISEAFRLLSDLSCETCVNYKKLVESFIYKGEHIIRDKSHCSIKIRTSGVCEEYNAR